MSRRNRRLALMASLEKSRARGLEAAAFMQGMEAVQQAQRIDALVAAGERNELLRSMKAAALANPQQYQTN